MSELALDLLAKHVTARNSARPAMRPSWRCVNRNRACVTRRARRKLQMQTNSYEVHTKRRGLAMSWRAREDGGA